jgi:very-short-patch-repair endonuclease
MTHDVRSLIGPDGWTTWADLATRVDRKTIGAWTATGRIVRLGSGVYTTRAGADDWRVRVEAAVRSRRAIASHGTALALWELVPEGGPVHLTVPHGGSSRSAPGVVLHRSRDLREVVRRVDGLPVTCVERAVVDCWGRSGQLGRPIVRAAAITAVRRRLCSPRDLAIELDRRPTLPGRAELAELVRLLAQGCRSELEIWGCLHVLHGPGMPTFTLQRRLEVRGQVFYLDAACEESMLAIELDGAAWHGSRAQRERDIRRDAVVATAGWQTLRFGYTRMTGAREACQRDILDTHAARLRLIHGDRVH